MKSNTGKLNQSVFLKHKKKKKSNLLKLTHIPRSFPSRSHIYLTLRPSAGGGAAPLSRPGGAEAIPAAGAASSVRRAGVLRGGGRPPRRHVSGGLGGRAGGGA